MIFSIFSKNLKNMEEEWRPIPGYEGLYEASNLGKIRSIDREIRHSKNGTLTLKGRVLKLGIDKDGYLQVQLNKNGRGKTFRVHRLVWMAFNGAIPENMQVNHVDEDKSNNRLENMNLMTCKENINFATRNQRVAQVLSKPIIALDADGNVAFEFPSTAEAERCGFNSGHLSACCRGRRGTHKGYRWKYKE